MINKASLLLFRLASGDLAKLFHNIFNSVFHLVSHLPRTRACFESFNSQSLFTSAAYEHHCFNSLIVNFTSLFIQLSYRIDLDVANTTSNMNIAPAANHPGVPAQVLDNVWTIFAHNINSRATSYIEMPMNLGTVLTGKGLEIIAFRFR